MRLVGVALLGVIVAGCSAPLDDATIEADFRHAMSSEHPDVRVSRIIDAKVGGGWDDGEVGLVYFEGECMTGVPCPDGTHMELLYQRDNLGRWRAISNAVVTRDLPPFTAGDAKP